MRVDLHTPQFVHAEACSIAGVGTRALEQWAQRGVISLGTKRRSGRRFYSIIDLIKLRVIGDLATAIELRPSFAAAVAENVLPRAAQVAALGPDGELLHNGYGADKRAGPHAHYLLAWVDQQRGELAVRRTTENRLAEAVRVPHPVIVVPLDEIALTVTLRALRMLDQEAE